MKKIKCENVFLILHYGDEKLTYRAVDSILNLEKVDKSVIVIVDNCSPNKSGKLILEKYSDFENIHVLLSEKNLGFSQGNNIGYYFIRDNIDCDFIVVMNNDIIFNQRNIIEEIKRLYIKYDFNVLGPDVYVPQRYWHSSPQRLSVLTDDELIEYKKRWESELELYKKRISYYALKNYLTEIWKDSYFLKMLYKVFRKIKKESDMYKEYHENCILQGSCIIFDKRYIENEEELFSPITFLYEEENILTLKCKMKNYKLCYSPEIQVHHTCQGSTIKKKQSYEDYCKKKINEHYRLIESTKIYEVYSKNSLL